MLHHRILDAFPFVAAAACGAALLAAVALADDSPAGTDHTTAATAGNADALRSGRDVGQAVPSFYVRAVTGPLRNKSVCYVCRNGDRPVVMVLMQRLDHGLAELLKGIDAVVDANRATGLRSFGVLISEEPSQDAPKLQTLAFDEKIDLPLTVATTVVSSSTCQNVHPHAAVTVVLYRNSKVVSTFAYRAGELDGQKVDEVLAGVRELAAAGGD